MSENFSIQEADVRKLGEIAEVVAGWSAEQWFAADQAAEAVLVGQDVRAARLAVTHDPQAPREVLVPIGYLYDLLDAISEFERGGGRDWLYARLAFQTLMVSVAVWDPAKRRMLAAAWLAASHAAEQTEAEESSAD
ncbi:MAG: hypothetical protein ACYDAG_05720 [Chloroflexota bacterium]